MTEPNFKIKEEKLTDTYGEFVIEPLEPGYGHTLGYTLRRALLISIPGAAITSVKINGAKHKFATLPGMKENVVDLLLNLKNLSLRLVDSKASSIVKLSVKGAKEVTAKDLDLPEDVEIVDKDHYIAALSDKKAKLEMEMVVEKGYGYSLAEERRSTGLGVIPTDAIYSPVKRVNYQVSSTRVGRQTNLDKLTLQIWTNGVVNPKDAMESAAKTVAAFFTQIYEPKAVVASTEVSSTSSVADAVLRLTVDELDLPTRIYNSLRNGGVETIGDILNKPRKELISMRNMGGKSIAIIEEKLKEKGIELTV